MSIQEQPWRTLIESIKRGNCILLLGPQVSFDPKDPDFCPLSIRLAQCLADHAPLSEKKELMDRNDVAHVAQLFRQQFGRIEMEMAVVDHYADFQALTTDFHRDLAALPFTLCINTTPDNFFRNALIEAGKTPVSDYYHFNRTQNYSPIQPTAEKPYIYNLYGHCDDQTSLVLTEDELLEFLINIIKNSPEVSPFILSQWRNPDINFLFVGFGFNAWHYRILLHALNALSASNNLNRRNQSLAVENPIFFENPNSRQTVTFYTQHHKIKFEQRTWLAFAAELHKAYIPAALPIAAKPTENLPKVFLCYASEDREQVDQLSQKLQTVGIEPWQDKQNLRAGDNWNLQLIHVIQKVVNYVVVVQTPAMTGQIEGYFYEEIATALER